VRDPPNRPSDLTLADFLVGDEDRPPVRFFGEVVCAAHRSVCFQDAVDVTGPSREDAHALCTGDRASTLPSRCVPHARCIGTVSVRRNVPFSAMLWLFYPCVEGGGEGREEEGAVVVPLYSED